MNVADVTSIISTVGFPIAMCVMFFVWFTGSYKEEQESTREIITELKETVMVLKASVETMTKLIEKE